MEPDLLELDPRVNVIDPLIPDESISEVCEV
jgi:hypothetical protein